MFKRINLKNTEIKLSELEEFTPETQCTEHDVVKLTSLSFETIKSLIGDIEKNKRLSKKIKKSSKSDTIDHLFKPLKEFMERNKVTEWIKRGQDLKQVTPNKLPNESEIAEAWWLLGEVTEIFDKFRGTMTEQSERTIKIHNSYFATKEGKAFLDDFVKQIKAAYVKLTEIAGQTKITREKLEENKLKKAKKREEQLEKSKNKKQEAKNESEKNQGDKVKKDQSKANFQGNNDQHTPTSCQTVNQKVAEFAQAHPEKGSKDEDKKDRNKPEKKEQNKNSNKKHESKSGKKEKQESTKPKVKSIVQQASHFGEQHRIDFTSVQSALDKLNSAIKQGGAEQITTTKISRSFYYCWYILVDFVKLIESWDVFKSLKNNSLVVKVYGMLASFYDEQNKSDQIDKLLELGELVDTQEVPENEATTRSALEILKKMHEILLKCSQQTTPAIIKNTATVEDYFFFGPGGGNKYLDNLKSNVFNIVFYTEQALGWGE